jgi:L-ascorbate metabolism protein UlaG (beta-lactamase superfamily)
MSLFSEPDPRLFTRGSFPESMSVRIKYLGTAGFVFESEGHTIVVDPYVSRPSVRKTLTQRLQPDIARIHSYIPRADHVLIGHAHHDHMLDAPALCKATGAQMIGSRSACNVARSAGLDESLLREVRGRETLSCGPHSVTALPSRHGKVFLGRVLFPGAIPSVPEWPLRAWQFRHGQVFNWHLQLGAVGVVHIDSADFLEHELANVRADILCLCAAGRQYRPDYVRRAIELLRPKVVIPCHWDVFTTPIEAPAVLLPGIDLPGLVQEIAQLGARPVVLPFLGEFAY